MLTRNIGWVKDIQKPVNNFLLMFFAEQIPCLLPVREKLQLGLFQLWGVKKDRLCVYEVEGALLGAWPHHQGHQRGELRGFLLHLFSKVNLEYRRILLPQKLRMVPESKPHPCGGSQCPNLRVQINLKISRCNLKGSKQHTCGPMQTNVRNEKNNIRWLAKLSS